jgi:hypothetical protein
VSLAGKSSPRFKQEEREMKLKNSVQKLMRSFTEALGIAAGMCPNKDIKTRRR